MGLTSAGVGLCPVPWVKQKLAAEKEQEQRLRELEEHWRAVRRHLSRPTTNTACQHS